MGTVFHYNNKGYIRDKTCSQNVSRKREVKKKGPDLHNVRKVKKSEIKKSKKR